MATQHKADPAPFAPERQLTLGQRMFAEWIESRIALAQRLANGEGGDSYAAAFLVLSRLISGVAADL